MSFAASAPSLSRTARAAPGALGALSSLVAVVYGVLGALTLFAGAAATLSDGRFGIGASCLAGGAAFLVGVRAIASRPDAAHS